MKNAETVDGQNGDGSKSHAPNGRFREVVQVPKRDKELKFATKKPTENEILAKHKQKKREAAPKGKQPYYLKKSEIRKQKLMEKYKDVNMMKSEVNGANSSTPM